MKRVYQNLALVIVSILISWAGIEVSLRIWGPDVLALGNQYVFYRFDPVLGWANLPNSRGRFSRIEFSHQVQINSLGMRDREIVEKRDGALRVAFLGDSFTWGVGAAYGERFTEVLGTLNPRLDVLNFGVSGYAPIQYLLQLDQVLALKPDYVIVVFCLGNDLTDNVQFNPYNHPKPYAKLSADGSKLEIAGYPLPESKNVGPELIGAASASRIVGMIKFVLDETRRKRAEVEAIGAQMAQLIDEQIVYSPEDRRTPEQQQKVAYLYKVNELLLEAIRDRVEAGIGPGRFAVLLAPTKYEYGIARHQSPAADPNVVANGVLTSLSRLGIPAVDARTVIEPADFWKGDAHWRPSGHRKIGELLSKYFASIRIE